MFQPVHRRYRGADPGLLRQLRGRAGVSAVDQVPTALERAFAAWVVLGMVVVVVGMMLASG